MFRSLLLASRVALVLGIAGSAGAVSFPLNVVLADGTIGTFGNVEVNEVAGDLQFEITLDTSSLGTNADLHELYFNLVDDETGLAISSTDVVATEYELLFDPPPAGGAGSSFEFGVNFGDGAGPPGNGVLQTATFTLSADGALTVNDLLQSSSTTGDDPVEVFLAAHIQGSTTAATVGSLVPEPGTLGLLLLGLTGLSLAGRRTP